MSASKIIQRYVAIGDSSTEGFNDINEAGEFVGWSRRLAAKLSEHSSGELFYENFGYRGLTTAQIHKQQLAKALELEPDLITIFSGTNDIIGMRFDAAKLEKDLWALHSGLAESGCTFLSFTLPSLNSVMPLARLIEPRVTFLNERLREISASTGSVLVDFAAYPLAGDRRFWHEDRLHANSEGHRYMANAMAYALELPGSNEDWKEELPPGPRRGLATAVGAEVHWIKNYYLPWIGMRLKKKTRAR